MERERKNMLNFTCVHLEIVKYVINVCSAQAWSGMLKVRDLGYTKFAIYSISINLLTR